MFRKLTWFYRVFLSALFVALAFLTPRIIDQPLRFFALLGAVTILQWAVLRLVFFRDLRKLTRTQVRLTWKTLFAKVVKWYSARFFKWGLFGSLALVAVSAVTAIVDIDQLADTLASVAVLGISAAACGYALKLKLAQKAQEAATAEN